MRPLLIGQAPGSNTDPGEPLSGASGRRLAALCDLDLDEFLARFERANLLPEFPGKLGKGDRFVPIAQARPLARAMLPRCAGRRVVLLGNHVAAAFGWRASWLRWSIAPAAAGPDHQDAVLGVRALAIAARGRHPSQAQVVPGEVEGDVAAPLFAVSPHPSGISHWWNEPTNVRRARRFWRRLAQEAARDPAAFLLRPSS